MARWKALPAGLDPAVVELIIHLRQLKDSTGVTLDRLAEATGFSVSSWRRYLDGASLPPREAAEQLARFAAADTDRLLARYDAAREAWEDRVRPAVPADAEPADAASTDTASADADPGDPAPGDVAAAGSSDDGAPAVGPPEGSRTRRNSRQLRTVVYCAASAVVGAGIGLLVGTSLPGGATPAPAPVAIARTPVHYACTYTRRDGRWYAGNSPTDTAPLEVDMSGPQVAELQCLLQHAGFSPGGVDGNFGPLTEAAVIRAQKADRLDVDGQVGPMTWGALRG